MEPELSNKNQVPIVKTDTHMDELSPSIQQQSHQSQQQQHQQQGEMQGSKSNTDNNEVTHQQVQSSEGSHIQHSHQQLGQSDKIHIDQHKMSNSVVLNQQGVSSSLFEEKDWGKKKQKQNDNDNKKMAVNLITPTQSQIQQKDPENNPLGAQAVDLVPHKKAKIPQDSTGSTLTVTSTDKNHQFYQQPQNVQHDKHHLCAQDDQQQQQLQSKKDDSNKGAQKQNQDPYQDAAVSQSPNIQVNQDHQIIASNQSDGDQKQQPQLIHIVGSKESITDPIQNAKDHIHPNPNQDTQTNQPQISVSNIEPVLPKQSSDSAQVNAVALNPQPLVKPEPADIDQAPPMPNTDNTDKLSGHDQTDTMSADVKTIPQPQIPEPDARTPIPIRSHNTTTITAKPIDRPDTNTNETSPQVLSVNEMDPTKSQIVMDNRPASLVDPDSSIEEAKKKSLVLTVDTTEISRDMMETISNQPVDLIASGSRKRPADHTTTDHTPDSKRSPLPAPHANGKQEKQKSDKTESNQKMTDNKMATRSPNANEYDPSLAYDPIYQLVMPKKEDSVLGTFQYYIERCSELERIRHAKVYEAEKRKLYAERIMKWAYEHEMRIMEEEYESARRMLSLKLLQENAEKQRRVEELRFKFYENEANGLWRRHEMSLRGRGQGNPVAGPEGSDPGALNFLNVIASSGDQSSPEKNGTLGRLKLHETTGLVTNNMSTSTRNRRRGARVRVELETMEVQDDLAELVGNSKPAGRLRRSGKNR